MKCGRWLVCVVFLAVAALAACSSSVTSVQPATVPPSSMPTPGYPTDHTTYSYASRSWAYVRPAAPATPIALPTAYSTQDERVTTGATFDGRDDLIDVKSVYRAPSEVETSDDYLQWVPVAGGQALEQIGRASSAKGSTDNGSGQTVYTIAPPAVQVPFIAGNSWDGANAYHTKSSSVEVFEGASIKSHFEETWNQDGSYVRGGLNWGLIFPGIRSRSTASVASDGSAAVVYGGKRPFKTSIGVPIPTASGGYVIPVVDILGKKANIPDWYPGGALPPSPLVAVTVVDRGMKKLPAGCDVPQTLATRGEAIVRTLSQFDPNGIVNASTDAAYYAPGIGVVCDVQSSQSSLYIVLVPAARLVATQTSHAITSLTRLSRKAGSVRAPGFADALPFAAGAVLSDAMLRRVTKRAALVARPLVYGREVPVIEP